MTSVRHSGVTVSLRNRRKDKEIGRYREGFESRVGGSSLRGKVAGAWLFIVFAFCCGWRDCESYDFFSAYDFDSGFFADYVVCQ